MRSKQWNAFLRGENPCEVFELTQDVEEKHNIAHEHEDVIEPLVAHAEKAHQTIRPGKVYDRKLIEKDRRQAPHARNRPKTQRNQ